MRVRMRTALTLIELVVVVLILVALAGVVVPQLSGTISDARPRATRASLQVIQQAIMGSAEQPGYFQDLRAALSITAGLSDQRLPLTLADLFRLPTGLPAELQSYDPVLKRGWRGPYLHLSAGRYSIDNARGFTNAYGQEGDPAVLDGFGRPIVVQRPTDTTETTPIAIANEQSIHIRLLSAGPNGVLDTPQAPLIPTASERGDDILVFLRRSDSP